MNTQNKPSDTKILLGNLLKFCGITLISVSAYVGILLGYTGWKLWTETHIFNTPIVISSFFVLFAIAGIITGFWVILSVRKELSV